MYTRIHIHMSVYIYNIYIQTYFPFVYKQVLNPRAKLCLASTGHVEILS